MKLSKADLEIRATLLAKSRAAWERHVAAVEKANETLQTLRTIVDGSAEAVNSTLGNLTDWLYGRRGEISEYIESKSERWQESDAGEAYTSWLNEFDGIDLSDVEAGIPEDFFEGDEPDFDSIENLPGEATP